MPHQVNGSQRVGGGHVRPHLPHGPDGFLGLAQVILADGLGVGEGLAG